MKRVPALIVAVFAMLFAHPAAALDKVTFATNWLAEAEHGGFYQAVADGTYQKYGLDVTIVEGGPQVNNRLKLAAGRVDFYMGANMIAAFAAVQQKLPTIVVAAIFQKDPLVLMSHPGVGLDHWEDLPKAPIFLSAEVVATTYRWLEARFGFTADHVKPYTFNPVPFIADKQSVQEGYVTSEPYAVAKQGHFQPNVFLVADHDYAAYSTTIETRTDLVERNPDLVQQFVDASVIGWYNYLYGDNAKANALIKHDNPDMADDQIAYSIAKLKEYGIVNSGDAVKLGIGALTDDRVKAFFGQMSQSGILDTTIDYRKAFTTQFVDKGVGLDLRPKD